MKITNYYLNNAYYINYNFDVEKKIQKKGKFRCIFQLTFIDPIVNCRR